jgi:ornithine carbamoyltransferase
MARHFLDLDVFPKMELLKILKRAETLKLGRRGLDDLRGKTLAMIFEKASTRTRISFEVAMRELGGDTIALTGKEMQLEHGESLADTARVMNRFVHALMVRTFEHENLQDLARHATIPVINGLTNSSHPCQVMADLMTVQEKFHRLEGLRVAWCGDGGSNVLMSWLQTAATFNFQLAIASPESLMPDPKRLAPYQAKADIQIFKEPADALKGADVVLTDTWVSMHNEDGDKRRVLLKPYQINSAHMKLAKPQAVFMHCLPAHRGEEVTAEVIDGPQSAVWDEAENRLHVQKAILLWCFGKV